MWADFAASPWTNLGPALPTAPLTGGFLTLTSIRRKSPADVSCAVEVSGDLATWTNGPAFTAETSVTPIDASTERVTACDTTPASAGKRCIRVRVSD